MDANVHPIGYSADDHSEWNAKPSNADVAAALSTMLSWIGENRIATGFGRRPCACGISIAIRSRTARNRPM